MKKLVPVLLTIILAASQLLQAQSQRMIDEIKNHGEGQKLWWAGHNSWIIKSDDLVVTTDLFLEDVPRIKEMPITAEEVAEVIDVSFVTHWHGDHFNEYTSKILLENSDCLFVLPESGLSVAEKIGIPKDRMVIARPRESFEVMGIKVDALRAIHGNADFAIYYQANLKDVGYRMNIDGTTFLQPGDTYLLEDHLFLEHVDVLFVSPTEHNMYIDRSVILINRLNPDFIFPQHHSTLTVTDENRFWAKGYPDEVKIRLSQPLKDKYHIVSPGESWAIE